jgi:hypothetical protein
VPLMLGAGGGVGLRPPAMPRELGDMGIPHSILANSVISPADQAKNAALLDSYWWRAVLLRGMKALNRYYRLNDPSGWREHSLLKAIIKAERCVENNEKSSRVEDDDGEQDDDEALISFPVRGLERGNEDGRLRTAGEVGWRTRAFIATIGFIIWIWFAAVLIGRTMHRIWMAVRRIKRAVV